MQQHIDVKSDQYKMLSKSKSSNSQCKMER